MNAELVHKDTKKKKKRQTSPMTCASGERNPLLQVDNQAEDACIAFSPNSDLEVINLGF